ncbi:MAG: tetratricopeptide repeat protein [Bacillota bacterium]
MLKKITFLICLFILISSSFLLASEPSLEQIQALVSQDQKEEALRILNNYDISSNSDLKFYQGLLLSWEEEYQKAEAIFLELIESNPKRLDSYTQLARIYGWQRQFEKAELIIKRAQKINYGSERTVLLAKHAEWQQNYFRAKRLLEEAVIKAETEALKKTYQQALTKIEQAIKSVLYIEARTVYSADAKEDLELNFGIEKLLKDGLNFESSVGINYYKNDSNFVFKSKLETGYPLLSRKNLLSSEFIYYNGSSRDKYELNNSFDHLVNPKNLIGVNLNLIEDNDKPDYQSLELEYEHRFEKVIMVLKNTSRNYDSTWIGDFSQHLDLYFPQENYLLNLALSHYQGGEYVFKVGFEFSDLFSGEKFSLSSLNLWTNTDEASNLDFRVNLK